MHCRLCSHAKQRDALRLTDLMVELRPGTRALPLRTLGKKLSDVTSVGSMERQREDRVGVELEGKGAAEIEDHVSALVSDESTFPDKVNAGDSESERLQRSTTQDSVLRRSTRRFDSPPPREAKMPAPSGLRTAAEPLGAGPLSDALLRRAFDGMRSTGDAPLIIVPNDEPVTSPRRFRMWRRRRGVSP